METKEALSSVQIGKVLGEAFFHYPVMDYAFKGDINQLRKLEILYECCANATQKYGGIIQAPDQNGILLWIPRKSFPLSLLQECSTSLMTLPFRIGFQSTWRLNFHEEECVTYIQANAGPKMGYIWAVGVGITSQGKGHCRYLMEHAMDEMRGQGLNEFWLSTDTERNVAMYKRFGFEVMIERNTKCSGLRNWIMRRMDS